MVTEPNINKTLLKEALEKEYSFRLNEIFFNPKGEASWSYILETDKGKFFLKVFKDGSFNPKVFEFTFRLFSECDIENIIHPIKTANDEVYFSIKGFKLVLFNFIEGKTIKEWSLDETELESLGKLLAKVHKSHEIIGHFDKKEEFNIPYKEGVLKIYQNIDSLKDLNEPQREAKKIYSQFKHKFLSELQSLEELAQKLKNESLEFVNCHGEPSPRNIMISTDGQIYLIDWDFPFFAPKEKDLMFFEDKHEVLEGYKKVVPNARINEDVKGYYQLLWNVQEIEDWGTRLLLEKHSLDEDQHNFEELNNFLNYSGLK